MFREDDTFTRNLRTGEEESNRDVLAFRDAVSLTGSLEKAGFTVLHQYGDWHRQPLTAEAPEIIVIAQRVQPAVSRPPTGQAATSVRWPASTRWP